MQTIQVGYAILLDDEVFNYMRMIELLLFEKFGIKKGLYQSPHITIKSPFLVESVDPFIEYLKELSQKISPLIIEMEGFNAFGDQVIYLDVKENDSLFSIYETIYSDLKSKYIPNLNRDDMIFHATLGYGDISSEIFHEAFTFLTKNYQPKFTIKPKEIGLFYQLPGDSGWIIINKQPI